MKAELLQKIDDKSFVVGVIGLGYVGLPLNLCFTEKGFRSLGFDIDKTKVDLLNAGNSYIKHIPSDRIKKAKASGLFSASTDYSRLKECDAILIAVPTPLNKNREPE
ncbi:MAG TPA: nucleotide sugar dehydrogenase, partial [Terriglobia bacterium]|nr:nucleotide sugar dehydrogenase [Terriglobia bacterium]